jgi:hypothetical protein
MLWRCAFRLGQGFGAADCPKCEDRTKKFKGDRGANGQRNNLVGVFWHGSGGDKRHSDGNASLGQKCQAKERTALLRSIAEVGPKPATGDPGDDAQRDIKEANETNVRECRDIE